MKWYLEAFKNFGNFSGRASRKEYWMFALFNGIIVFVLRSTVPVLCLVYSLIALIPSIAIGVRRMHDVGKSGWFILIPLYSLYLFCKKGQSEPNEYGVEPQ